MSIEEENKIGQRRVWEEIYNNGNYEIIPELFATNWVEHTPLGDLNGLEGFKQGTIKMRTAFPDINITIDDMFAKEDKVVSRVTMTGTFKGEYMGIAPTGKNFIQKVILITQWADGKEIEAWGVYDTLVFYRQLGIPIPSQ